MKNSLLFLLICFNSQLLGQSAECVLKPPVINIHFGSGKVPDLNAVASSHYERVDDYCPRDGYYTYTNYTSDCFNGVWHTLTEDHTPGDASGNMLLVNSAYESGSFFKTTLKGLKTGTDYQFALWLLNVYRPWTVCASPSLPDILIRLQTEDGKTLAQFGTGEIQRSSEPLWIQYRAFFTMPAFETSVIVTMFNNNRGGCGNDFALDDITLRECVPPAPVVKPKPEKIVATKKRTTRTETQLKKITARPVKDKPATIQIPKKDSQVFATPVLTKRPQSFPPPPPALATRTNTLVKQIDTQAGEIRIDLYDNGEIDGDTVTIYHNNVLVKANARLTQKATTMRIVVDVDHPHHELVMVADNLGSIPPNTSLMIITAGTKRYQVFISSDEQKNAKVIFDLKE